MRRSSACLALALLGSPSLLLASGAPPRGKAEPATVPYLCNDGRPADVVYEGGSDYRHARARIRYDGRMIEMRAAPTLYGVRYRTPEGEGDAPLAWSLRGEEAWLTDSPDEDGYTREEHVRARCVRLRDAVAGGAHASAAAPH